MKAAPTSRKKILIFLKIYATKTPFESVLLMKEYFCEEEHHEKYKKNHQHGADRRAGRDCPDPCSDKRFSGASAGQNLRDHGHE
jgi:hypothetical protein